MPYDMKAVLLVGGLGTRLRSVVSRVPKPMASVGGRPFLELLILQLRGQGFRRLILCTYHQADSIQEEFGNGESLGVQIQYSTEPCALGTAGAIRHARELLGEDADFLVLNGDSFLAVDFNRLIDHHHKRGAIVTMAVTSIPNGRRYGTVEADSNGNVTRFAEKADRDAPAIINAGIYVFNRAVLDHIPEGYASLEKDVFPHLMGDRVCVMEQSGMFIDIGTPDDYARAQAMSDHLSHAASARTEGNQE